MKQYLLAFLLSILLTFVAYFVVDMHLLPSFLLMAIVGISFLLQAGLQFAYFLRMGQEATAEKGGGWNLLFFLFTILILLCVVVGSIWIMYNLNYRM